MNWDPPRTCDGRGWNSRDKERGQLEWRGEIVK